ncbi:MAG: hypothetical protein CL946_06800 [Ectothiorhodospiraceae bacterium]|nr:hypothetical protein [Ectothiorhodospiraceae bacterium]
MRRALCNEWSDKLFDGASEFYWTWSVFLQKNDDDIDLAQGFSVGCPVNDGYAFNNTHDDKKERILNDPRFTVQLPEVPEGKTAVVRLDIHCWEADNNAEAVKKAFTNAAAQKFLQIYEEQQQRQKAALDKFAEWLDDEDDSIIQTLINAGTLSSSTFAVAKDIIGLIGAGVNLLQNSGHDYIGIWRAELFIENLGDRYRYRWRFDDGVEEWWDDEGKIYRWAQFKEYDGSNMLHSKLLLETTNLGVNSLVDPDTLRSDHSL